MLISPYLKPTPFQKMLLGCIRDNFSEVKTGAPDLSLSEEEDLDYSLPTFWHPCCYLKFVAVPSPVHFSNDLSEKLRDAYVYNAAKNICFCNAAAEIAKALRQAGIPSVFFKGTALINTIYKDENIRVLSDIDLCVHKKDILTAENVILGLGYTLIKRDEETRGFHHVYSKGWSRVELHWNVDNRISDEAFDKFLNTRRTITVSGEPFDIFNPAGEVLACCFNFNRAFKLPDPIKFGNTDIVAYRGLFFLYELKRILRFYGKDFDWEALISLAGAAGRGFEVFSSIILAEKVADARIPPQIIREMKNGIFMRLYSFFIRRHSPYDFIDLFAIRNIIMAVRFSRYKKSFLGFIRKLNAVLLMYLYFYHRGIFYFIAKVRGYRTESGI